VNITVHGHHDNAATNIKTYLLMFKDDVYNDTLYSGRTVAGSINDSYYIQPLNFSVNEQWTFMGIVTDDVTNSTENHNTTVGTYLCVPHIDEITGNVTTFCSAQGLNITVDGRHNNTDTNIRTYLLLFKNYVYNDTLSRQRTLAGIINDSYYINPLNFSANEVWIFQGVVSDDITNSTENLNASGFPIFCKKFEGIDTIYCPSNVAWGEEFKFYGRDILHETGTKCTYLITSKNNLTERTYRFGENVDAAASNPQGYSLLTGSNGTITVRENTAGLLINRYSFYIFCSHNHSANCDFNVVYNITGEAADKVSVAVLANLDVPVLFFIGIVILGMIGVIMHFKRSYI